MKTQTKILGLIMGLGFVVGTSLTLAQDKKPADKPAEKPAAKPADKPAAKPADKPADKPAAKPADAKPADKAAPAGDKAAAGGPSPEDAAKWMAYSTPGPEHAMLKPLVGTFSCDIKMMMDPAAPPQTSTATITRKSIMGDRYITEDVESTFMGQPFQGHGVVGYDNGQKKYFSLWIDNVGTGVMHETGTASGKVITLEGQSWDPSEGKMAWGKSVVDLSNNDKQTFKMFSKDKSGKEFQNFDMTCTRK